MEPDYIDQSNVISRILCSCDLSPIQPWSTNEHKQLNKCTCGNADTFVQITIPSQIIRYDPKLYKPCPHAIGIIGSCGSCNDTLLSCGRSGSLKNHKSNKNIHKKCSQRWQAYHNSNNCDTAISNTNINITNDNDNNINNNNNTNRQNQTKINISSNHQLQNLQMQLHPCSKEFNCKPSPIKLTKRSNANITQHCDDFDEFIKSDLHFWNEVPELHDDNDDRSELESNTSIESHPELNNRVLRDEITELSNEYMRNMINGDNADIVIQRPQIEIDHYYLVSEMMRETGEFIQKLRSNKKDYESFKNMDKQSKPTKREIENLQYIGDRNYS